MKFLIALLFCASGALGQTLTGADVSFMDFKSVNPASICDRAVAADKAVIIALRRFAKFEALHNSHGGAVQAKAIIDCLDKRGINPREIRASAIRVPRATAANAVR